MKVTRSYDVNCYIGERQIDHESGNVNCHLYVYMKREGAPHPKSLSTAALALLLATESTTRPLTPQVLRSWRCLRSAGLKGPPTTTLSHRRTNDTSSPVRRSSDHYAPHTLLGSHGEAHEGCIRALHWVCAPCARALTTPDEARGGCIRALGVRSVCARARSLSLSLRTLESSGLRGHLDVTDRAVVLRALALRLLCHCRCCGDGVNVLGLALVLLDGGVTVRTKTENT